MIAYIEVFENSLKELEDIEREIIIGYFMHGYSGNKIASILGISISQLNRQKDNVIIIFPIIRL